VGEGKYYDERQASKTREKGKDFATTIGGMPKRPAAVLEGGKKGRGKNSATRGMLSISARGEK